MNSKFVLKSLIVVTILIVLLSGNTKDKTISGKVISHIEQFSFSENLSNEIASFEGLEKAEKRIERFLSRWEIKGTSVAVMKNDKLVYVQGFGYANIEENIKLEPYHLLRIASVSKLITGVAIMKLIEEEKLNLDDKVFGKKGILNDSIYSKYNDTRVEYITIRQLLTHKAGWTTKWGDHLFIPNAIAEYLKVSPPVSGSQIIEFALSKKLHYTPGKWSAYTNISYVILGEVIAEITHMPYEDYVNAAILYPLGIFNMRIGNNLYSERFYNEVKYYEQSNADSAKSIYGTGEMVPHCYGGTDIQALGAAGGWIATPSDLLKLVASIDANQNVFDILSEESVNLMTNQNYKDKALGWRGTDGKDRWWRTGSLAGTSALVKHENDSISWVIITNTSSWKGSNFTMELNKLMRQFVYSVKKWPDRDLFVLSSEEDFIQ